MYVHIFHFSYIKVEKPLLVSAPFMCLILPKINVKLHSICFSYKLCNVIVNECEQIKELFENIFAYVLDTQPATCKMGVGSFPGEKWPVAPEFYSPSEPSWHVTV
jgi:hypothetical protein